MIDLPGWTRDDVLDQVDHLFLEKLTESWRDYPPIRVMVGAYLGIKPQPPATKDFSELVGMFPGGQIR